MKSGYQRAIHENKNILNEVIQNANALRNEVNSYWRQLEEEGKEEVKHDYQLASDNYKNMLWIFKLSIIYLLNALLYKSNSIRIDT